MQNNRDLNNFPEATQKAFRYHEPTSRRSAKRKLLKHIDSEVRSVTITFYTSVLAVLFTAVIFRKELQSPLHTSVLLACVGLCCIIYNIKKQAESLKKDIA